jgi:hypothetical protein
VADWAGASKAVSVEEGLFVAFVSYSRRDANSALSLIQQLETPVGRIAFDQSEIRGGEKWQRKLTDLIRRAENVIFLISPASLGSEMCRWEIDRRIYLLR